MRLFIPDPSEPDEVAVGAISRWATAERDRLMERLGLTQQDVDEERAQLAAEAWYEAGRDD